MTRLSTSLRAAARGMRAVMVRQTGLLPHGVSALFFLRSAALTASRMATRSLLDCADQGSMPTGKVTASGGPAAVSGVHTPAAHLSPC